MSLLRGLLSKNSFPPEYAKTYCYQGAFDGCDERRRHDDKVHFLVGSEDLQRCHDSPDPVE